MKVQRRQQKHHLATRLLTLLPLAARNVLRNRSRSAFTVGAIGFGMTMTLLLGGLAGGLMQVMIDDIVFGKVGALQVHKRGYDDVKESDPLKFDMPQGGELARKIRATPGVTGIAARVVFTGLVNNGTSSTMFLGIGEDPALEYKILPLATRGLSGQALAVERPNGGVLGFELAAAMAVPIGGSVTLQAATRDGQQNALDLDVGGTVNNNAPMESKRMLHVPLGWAQDLLGMHGRVTEYAVSIADLDEVDTVAQDLQKRLGPDYHIQTWRELRKSLADMLDIQQIILGAVSFVFLAIAVVGVVNTMLMSVMERTREIGTMLAVGVLRGQVLVLFLFEAAALATLGVVGGSALGFGILGGIRALGGIELHPPGSPALIAIMPVPPSWLVVASVLACTLGSLLAAAWPAFRASRLRPVEALRAL